MSEQTTALTEREELAEVVCEALEKGPGIYDTSWREDCAMADVILAAGYRKPRTITTIGELDALNFEAVALDAYGTAYVVLKASPEHNEWLCPALHNDLMPSWSIMDNGPFTVLHEGDSNA